MSPTSSLAKVKSLWGQAHQVRSHYAAPRQELLDELDKFQQRHRDAYQASENYQSEADALRSAQPSVELVAQHWNAGRLEELQALGEEVASQASGNPFASIALNVRRNLSQLVSRGQEQVAQDGPAIDTFELEGAARIAAAIGDDPREASAQVNRVIRQDHFGMPDEDFVGTVSVNGLFSAAGRMGAKADSSEFLSAQMAKVAASAASDGSEVQEKLNRQYRERKDEVSFAKRKVDAQEFLADLYAESIKNPDIAKDMRSYAKHHQLKTGINLNGLIQSYESQLNKHDGDVDKLDWARLLKQIERTR